MYDVRDIEKNCLFLFCSFDDIMYAIKRMIITNDKRDENKLISLFYLISNKYYLN